MDPSLIGQVGVVLGSLGGALQFLRAFKWFPEWGYYAVAASLGVGALLFVNTVPPTDNRAWIAFFIANWPLFLTFVGTVMAGTKATSDAAKGGVVFIPKTDSR